MALCVALALIACSTPDPAPVEPPSPTEAPTPPEESPPAVTPTTVAIDIGHTPANGGATSARGVPEYEFNRRMAGELLTTLHEAGHVDSFLINAEGGEITLQDRTRLAAEGDADLLISLHHDSVQPHYLEAWEHEGHQRFYCDRFQGYSLLVSGRQAAFEQSQRWAKALGKQLVAAGLSPTLHHNEPIEGENRPLLDQDLGVYQYDGLAVLRRASMPSVILECGILVNRDEEALLNEPKHRQSITAAIMRAVEAFRTPGE